MMRPLRFVLVSIVLLTATAAIAEVGRRVLDGYLVLSWEIVKDPASVDLTWSDVGSVDTLMRAIERDAAVDVAWFYDRPQPLTGESPAWADARRTTFEAAANYVWNIDALADGGVQAFLQKYKDRLGEIFTFRPLGGSSYPLYRFYPNLETGYGYTNAFGWRSRSIEAAKPPRTIRIGVLGDSTTGAYPRLIEHWLNLWATREHLNVRFDVANAARPASGALDAAAILDFELGSVDIDYVIVYGFGNGVYVADGLIKLPPGVVKGQPPAAAGSHTVVSRAWGRITTELGRLSRWSAAAAFLRGRMLGQRGAKLSAEPAKPPTRVEFPAGISEQSPDPRAIASFSGGGVMGLDTYLKGLERIDQLVKERGLRLFVSTFRVMAFDGMLLDRSDSSTQGVTYSVLNERYWWPYTYAQIHRLISFYNRALGAWAQVKGHEVIPINEQMPWRPDLYGDGMHETPAGDVLHGWIVLQHLIPRLREDLASGRLPRLAQPGPGAFDSYWKITPLSVMAALKTALVPAAPPDPLSAPADEIGGAFPLSALARAYQKAKVVAGDPPLITTAPESQAYAAAIPLAASVGGGLTGKGWVSIRVRVQSGSVSLGVLNKSAQKFLSSVSVAESPDIRQVHVLIDDLSEVGSLMMSNNRPGEGLASVAELHGVTLMKIR